MTGVWSLLLLCLCVSDSTSEFVQRSEYEAVVQEMKALKASLDDLKGQRQSQKRQTALPSGDQAAFSVSLSSPGFEHMGDNQIVKFDTIISNLGNAFDQRLGVFTAKTNGWYVFSLTIMTRPSTVEQMDVVKNGAHVFHVYSEGNEFNTASKTIVFHMDAGDEVWVQRTASQATSHTLHGYGHTSFTGFLLYLDNM